MEGTAGTCRWKYAQEEGKLVLRIYPDKNESTGSLNSWNNVPAWSKDTTLDEYRKNTKRIIVEKKVKANTCLRMFKNFEQLESVDLSGLDTTAAISMKEMFSGCSKLKEIDGSKFKVSKVKNMNSMFYRCSALTSVGDISDWKTGSVTDMSLMFDRCKALTSLDLSKWNTEKVKNMTTMFQNCYALTSVGDIKDWKTGSVTNMSWMFNGCGALKTVGDIKDWKTASVTNMSCMFHGCSTFTSLDLGGWDTKKVKNMSAMFQNCYALKSVKNIGKWKFSVLTTIEKMFSGCSALTSLDLTNWETQSIKNMKNVFSDCKVLTSVGDIKEWKTGAVTSMGRMFSSCYALPSLDLSGWDTSAVTDMEVMFAECRALASVNMKNWTTDSVTTMKRMFAGCKKLTSLNLGTWNTSKVSTMASMFKQTRFLKSIILGDNFHIKDDAKFEDAGLDVNTHWAQVAGGTVENPKGKVFASAKDLANFHHDENRQKRATNDEQYVRVTLKLTITFEKGASDVKKTMEPQSFNYGEEKKLTANAYERDGYDFDGWKDDGKLYADKELFKNTELAFNAQKTLTAQWKRKTYTVTFNANISDTETSTTPSKTVSVEHGKDVDVPDGSSVKREGYTLLSWTTEANGQGTKYQPGSKIEGVTSDMTLYAQWKKEEEKRETITLIYKSEDETKGTVSLSSEEVSEGSTIQGCTATALEGNEFVKWSRDTDTSWSHTEATLIKDVIERSAKKDGKFVPTTFTAHFEPKTYTITFDEHTSQGGKPTSVPFASITVKHGEDLLIPLSYHPSRRDYKFLGWKFQDDPTNSLYQPGATIKKLKRAIAFYSMWEEQKKTGNGKKGEEKPDDDTDKGQGVTDRQDPKKSSSAHKKSGGDKPKKKSEKENGGKNKTNGTNKSSAPKYAVNVAKTSKPNNSGSVNVSHALENSTHNKKLPATGDTTPQTLLGALALLPAAGIAVAAFHRRKKSER